MARSFVKEYFTGKSGDALMKTITPNWTMENLDRHLKLIDVPEDAHRIGEVGCGAARLLIPIHDSGNRFCCGWDASKDMIEHGRIAIRDRNILLIHIDGNGSLGTDGKNYFDFMFSIITFQHIPETETVKKYLNEMCRLLRPGGILRFQVLSHDIYPDRELWTYHPIDSLEYHLMSLDMTEINVEDHGRWVIISAKK